MSLLTVAPHAPKVRLSATPASGTKRRSGALVRERGALDPILEAQIRRHFFASPGAAVRYRVNTEEVMDHLICAGLTITPRPQRVLAHLTDVMQAVACVRGDATAWNDVINAHAWCLDRACAEQLGTTQGLTFARRFWRDLKAATAGQLLNASMPTRLQHFAGVRPLRLWLADRLLGAAASTSATPGRGMSASLDSERGSRNLPLPAGHAGGTAT